MDNMWTMFASHQTNGFYGLRGLKYHRQLSLNHRHNMATCPNFQVISYAKWLAFLICSVAFAWKVSDSFMCYLSKEIGTKTDLKSNEQIGLPALAICRHPNQILHYWNPETKQSIEESMNLTLAQVRYLMSYKVFPEEGLEPIFDQLLVNDSSFLRGATIAGQGVYSRVSSKDQTYISRPKTLDWSSFFHPLYGVCMNFMPDSKKVQAQIGSSSFDYLKISVDFRKAYPKAIPPKAENDLKMAMHDFQNQNGENDLLVIAYDQGSFLTTQQITQLNLEQSEKLTLEQEIVDKTKAREVIKCSKYRDITEDECLSKCLVTTYVQEFGCIHSRLSRMSILNKTLLEQHKICLFKDLADKTLEFQKNQDKAVTEEYGLVRIRQILASFHQLTGDSRCKCKEKCRKKVITVTKLPSGKQEESPIRFAHFHMRPFVKIYTYHVLYTGTDLVADIGGYLGLFLGFSIFGLVEILERVFLGKKVKKEVPQPPSDGEK